RLAGGAAEPASSFVVAIEAPAGLAAQPAGVDHALLQGVGTVARLLEERPVHADARRQVDVYPDEVEELERPHAETGGPHGCVTGLDRQALGVEAQRLEVEGSCQSVDDEPRAVARYDGIATQTHDQVDSLGHQ